MCSGFCLDEIGGHCIYMILTPDTFLVDGTNGINRVVKTRKTIRSLTVNLILSQMVRFL